MEPCTNLKQISNISTSNYNKWENTWQNQTTSITSLFLQKCVYQKKGQLYIQMLIPLFIIKSKSQMTTVKLI